MTPGVEREMREDNQVGGPTFRKEGREGGKVQELSPE